MLNMARIKEWPKMVMTYTMLQLVNSEKRFHMIQRIDDLQHKVVPNSKYERKANSQ